MNTTNDTVLVIGGTGKTGSRVAQRLLARGIRVRIGSRSVEPPFDWEDRGTWDTALRGVSAAYISYYPDLALAGSAEMIGALAERALAAGVPRLVLLSGRNEEEAERAEEALEASGADWTIIRCSWFMQNFDEGVFGESLAAGELALPAGDVGEPFVDVEDIADVAVAALTEDGHVGELYELTGPRLLTFADAVAEIGRAAGRELRYAQISPEAFEAELVAVGVASEFVELLRYLFGEVLDGRSAHVTDGVQRALGREARDFAAYARDTAAAGAWRAGVVMR
jgi:uncharacterized protein YbjT (DUF2867 family)